MSVDCIIKVTIAESRQIVAIAGRLTATELGDLLGACARPPGHTLVLELSDLMSMDGTARNLLSLLQAEGAELAGVPPYIRLLLISKATSE